MNQMLELLQYIARTAYKTQETVKTLLMYYDLSNDSDISNIYNELGEVTKTVSNHHLKLLCKLIKIN